MLFNSFEFFYFLTITAAVYYLPLCRPVQLQILVGASLIFYAWNDPALLTLLTVSIACNVGLSYRMAFAPRGRLHAALALGILFNLAVIVFFKYAGLAIQTLGLADTLWGRRVHSIPLPIGISFYTFEAISLLMDIARARGTGADTFVDPRPTGHVGKTSLFIAFFPHLISGPILKARDFYPQIGAKRLADVDWWHCARMLILGFFLKCVVADNLKDVTAEILFPKFMGFNSLTLAALLFGYGMQIFADFAGYSIIAVGLGALFGYRLPDNFNFPYVADSLAEFWRRWHISLSSWLREYLYIPLGGNRRGAGRTYLNLMLVMVLGGLWHGAAWSYAIWGVYHGAGLAVERLAARVIPLVPRMLRIVIVFIFVTLGWLLFKLPNFHEALLFLQALVRNTGTELSGQRILILTVAIFSLPVLIYHAAHLWMRKPLRPAWEVVLYGVMLAACLLAPGLSGAFIYFQF